MNQKKNKRSLLQVTMLRSVALLQMCSLFCLLFKGGFSSYAKSNPFAAAIANGQNKGGFGSGFGGFSAARTSVAMPPPLTLPSPKSPKANPFSSPSPAHNPFMTIVENNDDLWRSMANDKLTADDLAKTNSFGEVKDKKSPSFRGVFFGGNGHSSFGSVAASSLASGATTASIFGSSGPSQSTAAADDGDDDAGDEENEGDDVEDSPAANHASMKIISLPENVKLVTGEEDDECLFQVRAKMFRLNAGTSASGNGAAHDDTSVTVAAKEASEQESGVCEEKGALDASDVLSAMEKARAAKGNNKPTTVRAEWVEVGIGPLKILCRKSQTGVRSGGRLVMRREEKQGGQGASQRLFLPSAQLTYFLFIPADSMHRHKAVAQCPPGSFPDGEPAERQDGAGGMRQSRRGAAARRQQLQHCEDRHLPTKDENLGCKYTLSSGMCVLLVLSAMGQLSSLSA